MSSSVLPPVSETSDDEDQEQALKVVVIGDSNSGKTAICQRFTQHTFPQKYTQTVGVEFYSRRITLPTNRSVFLQLWDIGGHNLASTTMLNTYIFEAQAVLFVYDVTNTQSFENLTDWIAIAKKLCERMEKPFYMALVGNKTDNEHRRVVRTEKHTKTAEQHSMHPFYISAKTGDSIDLMFKKVAAEIFGIQLSKAEQEWNINVVQAQISNGREEPKNISGKMATSNNLANDVKKIDQAQKDSSISGNPVRRNTTICRIQ